MPMLEKGREDRLFEDEPICREERMGQQINQPCLKVHFRFLSLYPKIIQIYFILPSYNQHAQYMQCELFLKRTHLVNDTLQTCTQVVDVVLQFFGLAVNGVAFWMCQAGRFRGEESEGIGPRQEQRPSQRKQLILLQKQSHKTSFIAHPFRL